MTMSRSGAILLLASLLLMSLSPLLDVRPQNEEVKKVGTPFYGYQSTQIFDTGNQNVGGYHLLSGDWWEPLRPFTVSTSDWDGDGTLNSNDPFPTDPALPPLMSNGVTSCVVEQQPCYLPDSFRADSTAAWTYQNVANTQAMKWGDYDGDGDLDAVFGRVGFKNQVFENIGGTLSAEPVWESSDSLDTYDVEWGDMDGDGDLDLAVGNDGRNQVFINDNGVLRSTASWNSNQAWDTNDVDWADMDGDGDLDLVVCSNGDSAVIYRNVNGMLQTAYYWSSDTEDLAYDCDIGDIDGDGRMDLVIGWFYTEIEVMMNSAGGLPTSASWTPNNSTKVKDVALGDVDGDGDLDLFISNYQQKDQLHTNNDGVFSADPSWQSDAVEDTFDADWGDVDGDGDLDLALGTAVTNKILINDNGVLRKEPDWISATSHETENIEFGDIDGDGDLDFATANWGSEHEVFINPGSGFRNTADIVGSTSPSTQDVELFDIDGDGILEIAVAVDGVDEINRIVNGSLQNIWSSLDSEDTMAMVFADFDKDGDLDMARGRYGNPSDVFFNFNGTFGQSANWSAQFTQDTTDIEWGDMNGDGWLDLILGNEGERNQIYFNDGTGTLSSIVGWSSSDFAYTYGIETGDLDGDGDQDIIVANNGANQVFMQGSGGFSTTASWTSSDSDDSNAIELGDLDDDGDLDLLICNGDAKNMIYTNNGGGSLSSIPSWTSASVELTMDCELLDADDDGDLDLAFSNKNQHDTIYLNQGTFVSTVPAWKSASSLNTWGIDSGDIDGDGILDMVFGNMNLVTKVFLGGLDNDGDWVFSSEDDMQRDPTNSVDSDNDGFGEEVTGMTPDGCSGLWGDSWRDRWGCPDLDSDGQSDLNDAFFQKDSQWNDSDGDGLGDNWGNLSWTSRPTDWPGEYFEDAYLQDPSPLDHDNDGFEDQSLLSLGAVTPYDDCPLQFGNSIADRSGCPDSDGDGTSDAGDAFPIDPTQVEDSDGDGWGDNLGGYNPDRYPDDPTQHSDSDGDGRGDNASGNNGDIFPFESSQWSDEDGDGYGDNSKGFQADACVLTAGNSSIDRFGCLDSDGDGWSNQSDFDDKDALQWSDDDGDEVGDQLDDQCPLVWGDSRMDRSGCLDSDGDGWSDPTSQWPASPQGQADSFPTDSSQWADADGDGFGDNPAGKYSDDCVDEAGSSTMQVIDSNLSALFGCADVDGDQFEDDSDDCPLVAGTSQIDRWGCIDTDFDGLSDLADDCITQAGYSQYVKLGCPDSDGDGLPDLMDPYPGDGNGSQMDWDADGWPNPADFSAPLSWEDAFPLDASQWSDRDGDGLGDNPNGSDADDYPDDGDNDGYDDDVDAFPNDPLEWLDTDGDKTGDNADSDADGDGHLDEDEIRQGYDPFDAGSHPVDSFELVVPGTTIGLGAWDLMGITGGVPLFVWIMFGLITRNSRTKTFEEELFEAASEEQLANISDAYERALMWKLIGPHQALRLERIRSNLEVQFKSLADSADGTDETDSPTDISPPPISSVGQVSTDGYEWLQHSGHAWYRKPGSAQEWLLWR